jgi:hypothetical protein
LGCLKTEILSLNIRQFFGQIEVEIASLHNTKFRKC